MPRVGGGGGGGGGIWCEFVIHKHNHDCRLARGGPGDTHTYPDFPPGSLSAGAEHMSAECCPSGTLTGRHLETPVSRSRPCSVIPPQVSVHACVHTEIQKPRRGHNNHRYNQHILNRPATGSTRADLPHSRPEFPNNSGKIKPSLK